MLFLKYKAEFDEEYKNKSNLDKSFIPSGGKYLENIKIKNSKGEKIEEYYKWQFIYSLIKSGMYSKDFIGVEVSFPKGNKNSAPIIMDGCIFDSGEWIDYYLKWITKKDDDAIDWLRNHLIGIIEFKKSNGKDIKKVFNSQIKPAIKESEKDYCIGFYYDSERLHIFHKKNNKVLRYDESKNEKGDLSTISDLSLELTDAYVYLPSFDDILEKINRSKELDRSKRTINDLDIISGVHSSQIKNAIFNILKKMERVGMVNERGYEILIQMLALKIFDEKRSNQFKKNLEFYETQEEQKKLNLLFYISDSEKEYADISDDSIQEFIKRMRKLYKEASVEYKILLKTIDTETISWEKENHIKVIGAIVESLQDYSFLKSAQTDLYQLVFYEFASAFTKVEQGQFVTPMKIINFLVNIVNPKNNESVIDPTVGIADFLSYSYINSNGTLQDSKLYGVDNSEQMIMLAKLNMLLNGDGNAILKHKPDFGSFLYKFNTNKELFALNPKINKNGNWDKSVSKNKLLKFNVVLTNPPFGSKRKFEAKTKREKEIAEMYELWELAQTGNAIDKGVLFLENAYRVLEEDGRLGIIISNSIASIDTWEEVRKWLLKKMRVVALFDLPPNVFADTGVTTTLIVAYKPNKKELEKLQSQNYEVFIRDINSVGYEVKTIDRVKIYKPIYKIDEENFEVMMDDEGNPLYEEDFTKTIGDFKEWVKTQEIKLKEGFL